MIVRTRTLFGDLVAGKRLFVLICFGVLIWIHRFSVLGNVLIVVAVLKLFKFAD